MISFGLVARITIAIDDLCNLWRNAMIFLDYFKRDYGYKRKVIMKHFEWKKCFYMAKLLIAQVIVSYRDAKTSMSEHIEKEEAMLNHFMEGDWQDAPTFVMGCRVYLAQKRSLSYKESVSKDQCKVISGTVLKPEVQL